MRTNNKVSERNNKIRTSNSTATPVPDEWVFYAKTFVCTHAGKYKPRGEGKRKRQQSRLLGCEAQVGNCSRLVSHLGFQLVSIDSLVMLGISWV